MLIEGQVGQRQLADGTENLLRTGRTGELVVADAHGRYYENTSRGRTFLAANSASQALSTASATATGLILTNPAGSGFNLYVLEICVALSAAVTAVADIAVFANVNPVAAAVVHTTPLIVRNALLGGSGTPVGLADSAATLPVAPVIVRPLIGYQWLTGANGHTAAVFVKDEVAGALGLAPGTAISIQGLTAVNSVIASITWEELAV